MTSRMQQRRDTAANWTSNNPTLAAGEIGIESDTKKMKVGDGTTAWTSLTYAATGTVTSITAGTGLSGGTITGSGTIAIDSTVATLTGTQTLTNKTLTSPVINTSVTTSAVLVAPQERLTVSATAATGTVNFDASTQGVLYYTTNASANWTLNVRGSSGASLNSIMTTNDAITVVFLATQGSTAYYASSFTIDGSAVTPKWQTGSAPTSGNASSIDAYSYTIIKTGSATFTVLASQTKFA